MKPNRNEIIVIVGPTASGKSDYAISLAHEIGGEIISADSRQVYRGMDIGTGKVPRDTELTTDNSPLTTDSKQTEKPSETLSVVSGKSYVSSGIRHHLLDVASPKCSYNVTHFLRDANAAIADIRRRGKIPIICGGTNFWIEALVFGTEFPEVKPDPTLRKTLGKLDADTLFRMLEEKDPDRAETIDPKNKVRLIRAIEIISALGSVPKIDKRDRNMRNSQIPLGPPFQKGERQESSPALKSNSLPFSKREYPKGEGLSFHDFRFIGIDISRETLRENIEIRLEKRLSEGMVEEVEGLRKSGISWGRLEAFGLEYRWIARLLQGKITEAEIREKLTTDIVHYAKRQMTFLRRLERRGIRIEWRHL